MNLTENKFIDWICHSFCIKKAKKRITFAKK